MAASNFYCKEIAEEMVHKHIFKELLEKKKSSSDERYVDKFTQAANSKARVLDLQAQLRQLQLENQREMSMISAVTEKIDRCVKKMDRSRAELEKTKKEEQDYFSKSHEDMFKIAEMYQSFDAKFKEDEVKKQISLLDEHNKVLEVEIEVDKKKLKEVRTRLDDFKKSDLPDLKSLTEAIEMESRMCFGDPVANQKKVSELRKSIAYMDAKLKELNAN